MRRCWGRTSYSNFNRCKRIGKWKLLCHEHRNQWLYLLSFIVLSLGTAAAAYLGFLCTKLGIFCAKSSIFNGEKFDFTGQSPKKEYIIDKEFVLNKSKFISKEKSFCFNVTSEDIYSNIGEGQIIPTYFYSR